MGGLGLISTNYGCLGGGAYLEQGQSLDVCEVDLQGGEDARPWGEDCWQFLYNTGLWVGALRQVDGLELARVSTANEGWERNVREFWPGHGSAAEMERWRRAADFDCEHNVLSVDTTLRGDECLRSAFCDTLSTLPAGFSWDLQDADHQTLGLQVEQELYTWSASPAIEDIALVCYRITNIGSDTLWETYAGLHLLADAMHYSEDCGWTDDYAWSRDEVQDPEGGSRFLQCCLFSDNDGRQMDSMTGELNGARHVLAVFPLQQEQYATVSSNWYRSRNDVAQDYGPAWASCLEDEHLAWVDSLGTPEADVHKYWLMRNGEHDPAFWECVDGASLPAQVLADGSSEAWLTPDGNLQSTGGTPSGVLSVGPLGSQLAERVCLFPGQSVELNFAFVLGRDFHYNSDPGTHPGEWDYSDLDAKICSLLDFWEGEISYPRAPSLSSAVVGESQVILSWGTELEEASFSLQRLDLHTLESVELFSGSEQLSYSEDVQNGDSLCYRLRVCSPEGWCNHIDRVIQVGYPTISECSVEATPAGLQLGWISNGEEMQLIRKRFPLLIEGNSVQYGDALVDTQFVSGSQYTYTDMQTLEYATVQFRAWRGQLPSEPSEWKAARIPVEPSNTLCSVFFHVLEDPVQQALCHESSTTLAAILGLDEAFFSPAFGEQALAEVLSQRILHGDALLLSVTLHEVQNPAGNLLSGVAPLLGAYQEVGGRILYGNPSLVSLDYELPHGDGSSDRMHISVLQEGVGSTCYNEQAGSGLLLDNGSVLPLRENLLSQLGLDSLCLRHANFDEGLLQGQGYRGSWNAASGMSGLPALQYSDIGAGFLHTLLPFYCFDTYSFARYCHDQLGLGTLDVSPREAGMESQCFELADCVPNPFNPCTLVSWRQWSEMPIQLSVYNLRGQLIRTLSNEVFLPGEHRIPFDGSALASGVYLIRLRGEDVSQSRKVLLLK